MTRKRRRLWIVLACGLGLGSATALALSAFSDNLVFFLSPVRPRQQGAGAGPHLPPGRAGRAGQRAAKSTEDGHPAAQFRVTDGGASVEVTYVGILPDLFREGQGVVTLGTLQPDGTFRASEVLAKHDETYMPKEVADALKKQRPLEPGSRAAAAGRDLEHAEPARSRR